MKLLISLLGVLFLILVVNLVIQFIILWMTFHQ